MTEPDLVTTVCLTFEKILCVDGVTPDDDLFELGGHSLLAAQLVTEMLTQHGIRVPLARFLDDPTPGALAALVEAGLAEAGTVPA